MIRSVAGLQAGLLAAIACVVPLVARSGDFAGPDRADAEGPVGLVVAEGGGSASADWAREAATRMVAHAREHLALEDVRVAILGGESRAMRRHFEAAGASAVLELGFARDDAAREELRSTHVVWMVGGDQSRYVRSWDDTPVEAHMEALWRDGGAIGGSSAGCAVLGEWVYDAREGSLDEREALADGAHPELTLTDTFLELVPGVLFDTHFTERGRLARLATMGAHLWREDASLVAVGLDDRTALVVDAGTGVGEVIGEGSATILYTDESTRFERPRARTAPQVEAVRCEVLTAGYAFDLDERRVVTRPTAAVLAPDDREPIPVALDADLAGIDGADAGSAALGTVEVLGLDDARALIEGRLDVRAGRDLVRGAVVVPRAFAASDLDEVTVGGALFALAGGAVDRALLLGPSVQLERRGPQRLRVAGQGERPHRSVLVLDATERVSSAASDAPAKGDGEPGRTRQSVALEGLRLWLVRPGETLDLR